MNEEQLEAAIEATLKGFLITPDYLRADRALGITKRWRKVETVGEWPSQNVPAPNDDLMPFVALSDKSAFIADAHPDLYGQSRHALYKKWHSWSPDSFMFLEAINAEGNWEPIAVSIILPLSDEATKRLAPNVVLNLTQNDIGIFHPLKRNLLIDTWIIDKDKFTTARGLGHGLVAKHLLSFGGVIGHINVIIEPDAPNIHDLARFAGFNEPKDGFYSLPVTDEVIRSNPTVKRLLNNARAWAQLPYEGEQIESYRGEGIS